MAQASIPPHVLGERARAYLAAGCNPQRAADALGLPRPTLEHTLRVIRRRHPHLLPPTRGPGRGLTPTVASATLADALLGAMKKGEHTVDALAARLGHDAAPIEAALRAMASAGVRLIEAEGAWSIDRTPPQSAHLRGALHTFYAEEDGTFVFGACGDQHYGSKYARPEIVEELYDHYAAAGARVVFNTGNWIDGEARFNVHDLDVRGMDAQLRHLAQIYPQRPGIVTYAVSGDDHEGWYSQREGVDIGRYAEQVFRDHGREDWVDLGYMEAPVRLVHPLTGKDAIILLVHPGGGSAYALSYTMQKIVESLDGGEKPAMLLAGHYHKLWYGNIRNVWVVQTGTAQDQTPFMRKKKLEAHVGGTRCRVTQDPATGAIIRCEVEIHRFFNRGYYANRWSHSGPVTMPPRAA